MTTSRITAINRLPSNKNYFLPNQAEFMIKRLPTVEFFCQSTVLPGVTGQPVVARNPFVDIKHTHDVVMFNEFEVTFAVDEYLENYMSVYEWVVRLGFPESHDQYLSLSQNPEWTGEGPRSDCSIMYIDSRGKQRVEVVFEEAFPIGISNINVDTRAEGVQFLTATASFAFTKYTMTRIR